MVRSASSGTLHSEGKLTIGIRFEMIPTLSIVTFDWVIGDRPPRDRDRALSVGEGGSERLDRVAIIGI